MGKDPSQVVDFRAVFEAAPAAYLLLAADPPRFTILAVNDAYLAMTLTEREGSNGVVGRGLFEVFPENPDDPQTTGEASLRSSLETVLQSKSAHTMAVLRYDIPLHEGEGSGFEERYWSPLNTPVFDERGQVVQIVHTAEDVTAATKLAAQHEALITVCAWSKAVQYEGKWLSFEQYLHERFGLSTSHGISPEALAKAEAELGLEPEPVAETAQK